MGRFFSCFLSLCTVCAPSDMLKSPPGPSRRIVKVSSSHHKTVCEIPHYLKTMWTSQKADEFSQFMNLLDGELDDRSANSDDPKTHYIGFQETFRVLEKTPQNILCVIACVDSGRDASLIPRICWSCHEMGVPLILGRDPRRVGKIFNNKKVKRVGCLALTKFAGSKEGLISFVLNMSAKSSDIHLAVSSDEVMTKFEQHCETVKGERTCGPIQNVPKIETKSQPQTPQKKKQKTGSGQKTSFFSNFD